ncbi:MAG: hypothetical protein WC992_00055 [Acholeplasmataceae bacterium]|jgi:hypothetical protein
MSQPLVPSIFASPVSDILASAEGGDVAPTQLQKSLTLEIRGIHENPGYSRRNGDGTVTAMIVADNIAALQQGFPEKVLSEHVAELGIANAVFSDLSHRFFPVNPETCEELPTAVPQCRWATWITISPRWT